MIKLFLETNILTFEKSKPQKPIDYLHEVLIPETNAELISCGMLLCMFHYNKFIINEKHRLEKMLQICSHPKHEIYLNQLSKPPKQKQNSGLINIPKRLIDVLGLEKNAKICNRCKKKY